MGKTVQHMRYLTASTPLVLPVTRNTLHGSQFLNTKKFNEVKTYPSPHTPVKKN
jgi:hypothetical protein